MDRAPATVEAVRVYLKRRIDRADKRIAVARKASAAKPRRGIRQATPASAPEVAERRAYRDALKALDAIRADGATDAVVRMAAEELERVKSALAKIYEITQHANHDISEASDWTYIEGESKAALNIIHEAERQSLGARQPAAP